MLELFRKLWRTFSGGSTRHSSTAGPSPAPPSTQLLKAKPALHGQQPAPVTDLEPLTRFVTDSDHLKRQGPRVKWRAFLPRPADNDLSIARIEGLDEEAVWRLGDELAAKPSGRTVFGRADLNRQTVRGSQVLGQPDLDVQPDEPPERHAIIIGWPADRDARKNFAQELADKARKEPRSQVGVAPNEGI